MNNTKILNNAGKKRISKYQLENKHHRHPSTTAAMGLRYQMKFIESGNMVLVKNTGVTHIPKYIKNGIR
jgi:hypothetical protein